MEIKLKDTERIDDIQLKGLRLIQDTTGFCFGVDAVLLANFATVRRGASVVDLGTGTGILGILLCAKTKLSKIYGIDIQKDVCDMAFRSVKLNNLENTEILKGMMFFNFAIPNY